MAKLKITETQIDNYNETFDQLQRFDEGFNVIFGKNEAGKSTLMDFIKNVFTKKSSSAKGYVKCELGDEVFHLVSGDTKKLKENDKYNLKINPNGFKTGFIINLDDLAFANKATEDELINVIKDSSGNAINQKQEEYRNNIYNSGKYDFTLTQKNGVSSNLKRQFDKLKALDSEIKELQSKEDDYNKLCQNLEILESEIKNLGSKINYAEWIIQKNSILKEKESIKINQKIIDRKSQFNKLREDFGALNSISVKDIEFERSKEAEFCDEKRKELREKFQIESVDDFELSTENFKKAKEITDKEKELNYKLRLEQEQLDELNLSIGKMQFEIKSTENKLIELGIENIEDYKSGKTMLSSYLARYSDLMNKAMSNNDLSVQKSNNKWFSDVFLLIFGAIFFACLGGLILYWNTSVKLILIIPALASFGGLGTAIMQKIKANETDDKTYRAELKKLASEIIQLSNKFGFIIQSEGDFHVKISSIIQNMNEKIIDYKHIEEDLFKERINLERRKSELELKIASVDEIKQKMSEVKVKKNELISELNIGSIDNIEEVNDLFRDFEFHKSKFDELEKSVMEFDKKSELFIKSLNEFVEGCDIENFPSFNKYDLAFEISSAMDKISEILYSNISAQTKLCELDNQLKELNSNIEKSELKDNSVTQDFDEDLLSELKSELDSKINERGMLRQQKNDLEKVTGLVDLKNNKNIELNRLVSALQSLMKKEIIYNLIQKSKEKFNEAQPNLVCAKEYFSKITGGKYSEIDFENKTVSGENKGEKEWSNLSRGTKEQLYLALRLGFANNYSKNIDGSSNGYPELPIIIDDAFVNFDKERTGAILKCLSDFSKTNQVLYFTCHSDMIKEILDREGIEYKEVNV